MMARKGVIMKICLKCLIEKELSEFGKDKQKKSGISTYCKACLRNRSSTQRTNDPIYFKMYADKYREKNRELLRKKSNEDFLKNKQKILQKSRNFYHKNKEKIAILRKEKRDTPEGRELNRIRGKKWRESNPDKYRKIVQKWQKANKIKGNAHAKVHRAVESGKLIRRNLCEKCNMRKFTEAHHNDYNKPLEVEWLCKLCHSLKHKKCKV